MRICVTLTDGYFPFDLRVAKEVRALVGQGHEVYVFCNSKKSEKPSEQALGATVERIPHREPVKKVFNLLFKMTGYRWHPYWSRRILRLVRQKGIDAIHTHDLPPTLISIAVARKTGRPAVVDLHECYPEMAQTGRRGISTRLFNSIRTIDRVQGDAATKADRVVITSEQQKDYLMEKYSGLDPDKFVIVPNFEELDGVKESSPSPTDSEKGPFNITFVGSMGTPGRGVQVAIEAMPTIRNVLPDARLVLVGDGAYLPELRALSARLELDDVVEFTGWVDFEEAMKYIDDGTVCFIPFLKESIQYDLGCPHKLFQYMARSRPVVVSDAYTISSFVEECGAGLIFTSGEPLDFARKVTELTDPETRRLIGEKGRKAVLERYNFESAARSLLEMYDELEGEKTIAKRQ